MKITERKLRQIIREVITEVNTSSTDPVDDDRIQRALQYYMRYSTKQDLEPTIEFKNAIENPDVQKTEDLSIFNGFVEQKAYMDKISDEEVRDNAIESVKDKLRSGKSFYDAISEVGSTFSF